MRIALARLGFILLSLVAVAVVLADQPDPDAPSRRAENGISPSTRPATQPTRFPELAGHADDEWSSYEQMHEFFVRRFVLSEGNGLSRQVTVADLLRAEYLYTDGTRWVIGRVALISVHKSPDAFAYVAAGDQDPVRDDVKNYKHDPLSAAQRAGVDKLRHGQQVVRIFEGKHAEVIGAIRLQKSCAECHRGRRGDLLGAFSYPLTREDEVLPPDPPGTTEPAP